MRRHLALAATGLAVATLLTVAPGTGLAADDVTHHEFQVNCSVAHRLPDDPIVLPGLPGASHEHSFTGNTTTNAHTTLDSLQDAGVGATSCLAPDDLSAYWFPTMFNGSTPVIPLGKQVIYYKSGVLDYTTVRPFPPGLRYVVGSPQSTLEQFRDHPGRVEGWECGNSFFNWDFPANCALGSQLNVRFQAPSCWDGVHLDSADHKSHMSYPVNLQCPASHPKPVPMLEFKIAFPVDGNMSQVRLASGRGFSWHYDFFNAWDEPTLAAMVSHCINGGLQCDPRGYDQYKPHRGRVLGDNYRLPGRP